MLKKCIYFQKICHHLCFSREEEFSMLPSKIKVADEKIPVQRQQLKEM
jgi:hypothetical protein